MVADPCLCVGFSLAKLSEFLRFNSADIAGQHFCVNSIKGNTDMRFMSQCRKCRTSVKTIATPYLLQQSIASLSRMLPPG